jgi:S1-C subfamily serine protease
MRSVLFRVFVLLVAFVPVRVSAQATPTVAPRVWFGFLAEQARFPLITSVTPNGPAERAGLLVGDTLVAIGGRPASLGVLHNEAAVRRPGDKLVMVVHRGARSLSVTLVLSEPAYTRAPTMLIKDSIDARTSGYLVAACREVVGPPQTAADSAALACAAHPTTMSMAGLQPTRMPLRRWVDAWGARFERQADPNADTNEPKLVVVASVDRGGTAQHAGLLKGDVVVQVNGKAATLEMLPGLQEVRERVVLVVMRGTKRLQIRLF